MKVDFVIAGTQRGGTTALYEYLRQHPSVGVARRKETHYFDHEKHFAKGSPNYVKYHARFDWKDVAQVRGEATPIYMYWQHAPARMWDYNPKLKIIVLLRDPIRRAYSHWRMECGRGRETLGFGEATRLEGDRCAQSAPLQHRVYSYTDRGFYSRQLRRIWEFFPRSQTLVLRHDEFVRNPRAVLVQVWEFLGLDAQATLNPISEQLGNYAGVPDADTFAYLRTLFRPEVRELEDLLAWDCSNWLDPG